MHRPLEKAQIQLSVTCLQPGAVGDARPWHIVPGQPGSSAGHCWPGTTTDPCPGGCPAGWASPQNAVHKEGLVSFPGVSQCSVQAGWAAGSKHRGLLHSGKMPRKSPLGVPRGLSRHFPHQSLLLPCSTGRGFGTGSSGVGATWECWTGVCQVTPGTAEDNENVLFPSTPSSSF